MFKLVRVWAIVLLLCVAGIRVVAIRAAPFFDADVVTWVNNYNQIAATFDYKTIQLFNPSLEWLDSVRIVPANKNDAIKHMEWSADGKWLAVTVSYRLQIWNWNNQQLYHEFSDIDAANLAWSPDSNYIAATDSVNSSVHRFFVLNPNGSVYRQIDLLYPDEILWSSDSRTIMYGAGGDTVFWDIFNDTQSTITIEDLEARPYITYLPEQQYAIRPFAPGIWLFDFTTQRLVRQLGTDGSSISRTTSVKNGRIAGMNNRTIFVWDVGMGKLISVIPIAKGEYTDNIFLDDSGSKVISYQFDDMNYDLSFIAVYDAATGAVLARLDANDLPEMP